MRRNAVYLLASLLVIVTITGCSTFGKKKADADPAQTTADLYPPLAEESAYGSDSYATYGEPAPLGSTYETTAPATAVQERYHTVSKSDTLYAIARKYYGDQRRWKDIYEANRSDIADPNLIRVGQRLVIP